jgi:surface antigen
MRKLFSGVLAVALVVPLGACTEAGPKEQVGTGLGAVLGGIGGAQIGRGSGRTAAIIGGTLLGALVGQQIGRSLDRTDEMRAQQVLEYNRTDQPASWHNPDTGAEVTMVPVRTYRSSGGEYCREYSTDIYVEGRREEGRGTACRQPDGTWKIMN